jgi:SAM-dependent methyltransferase
VDPSEARETVPVFDPLAAAFDRFTAVWDRIDPSVNAWMGDQLPAGAERGLDLGCGAGRHAAILAAGCREVVAVDASAQMLDLARANAALPNVRYEQRDGADLHPDRDGRFDVILSVHTLHHLGPPRRVLPLVRDLLAPGGTAVLVDIVDSGQWSSPDWHVTRAFANAESAYRAGGQVADAVDILRLLLHPDWLAMTRLDTPLTQAEFDSHYADAFPGATIVAELRPHMAAAVWHKPE